MSPHLSCFKHTQGDDSTFLWAWSQSTQIQELLADLGLELGSLEADAVWGILSPQTPRAENAQFQQKILIPAQCLWNTKREFCCYLWYAFLLLMKFLESSAQTSTEMETRGREKVLVFFPPFSLLFQKQLKVSISSKYQSTFWCLMGTCWLEL